MAKFILFLNRLINLYLYYVVMACFLSLIPYINPNYPLFKAIFITSGFYLIPPILGISFSPAIVLIVLVLCSMLLNKIYEKYYAPKDAPKVIIMTPEEFIKKISEQDKFVSGETDISDKNRKENEK